MEKVLHEINKYKDTAFPVGIYMVTRDRIIPEGRGYMDLHWHEELQFTLVTEGTLQIQVNAVDYTLTKGQAIFINRNLLHVTKNLTEDGCYISLNFPGHLLGFFPGSRMEQSYVIPYTGNLSFPAVVLSEDGSWSSEVLLHLKRVIRMLIEGFGYVFPVQELIEAVPSSRSEDGLEYEISIELTTMWHRMIQGQKDRYGTILQASKSDVRRQERIQSMLTFIHAHYMEDIHLEDIAGAAHVSVGESCRCFQNIVRKSPNQYLMGYRISKAMELLTETNDSVTEISGKVGFNDSSNFIQQFKKKNGITPKEYRGRNE